MSNLPDMQNRPDTRGVSIERVGIAGYRLPITVLTKDGEPQHVAATADLYVGLPHEYKGVNMSRFSESLIAYANTTLSAKTFPDLLTLLKDKMQSEDAYARFEFDYFLSKTAPVSKITAPQAYKCAFTGIQRGSEYSFILEVNVVAASVCPCSREMSLYPHIVEDKYPDAVGLASGPMVKFQNPNAKELDAASDMYTVGQGAHNQRSLIRVQVVSEPDKIVWIEDLISLIEDAASAPTYPILKRPDEKFVTERGYNNAKFSEDIIRDVQVSLNKFDLPLEYHIRVENQESIHPYSATCINRSAGWKF